MLEIGVLIPLNFLCICPLWPIHKADGPVETSSRLSRLEWSSTVSSISSPWLWYKKKYKVEVLNDWSCKCFLLHSDLMEEPTGLPSSGMKSSLPLLCCHRVIWSHQFTGIILLEGIWIWGMSQIWQYTILIIW